MNNFKDTVCQNCGKEKTKLVPAGVSKTKFDKHGNPKKYDAFKACATCPKASSPNTGLGGTNSPNNANTSDLKEVTDMLWDMKEQMDRIEKAVSSTEVGDKGLPF